MIATYRFKKKNLVLTLFFLFFAYAFYLYLFSLWFKAAKIDRAQLFIYSIYCSQIVIVFNFVFFNLLYNTQTGRNFIFLKN